MKFEYDSKAYRGEPVAYIDRNGALRLNLIAGLGVLSLFDDRSGRVEAYEWRPHDPTNRRVFYAGDSITITF
jgi:hypothetical protein